MELQWILCFQQEVEEGSTVQFWGRWTVLSTVLHKFQLDYDAVNPGWTVILQFDFAFGLDQRSQTSQPDC